MKDRNGVELRDGDLVFLPDTRTRGKIVYVVHPCYCPAHIGRIIVEFNRRGYQRQDNFSSDEVELPVVARLARVRELETRRGHTAFKS